MKNINDSWSFLFHYIAGIISINGSLLSVSNDLSTQQIQVNCYTFRVEPDEVTWRIGSELIDSIYQPVNGSQLLDSVDQTYIHYIRLNGSFSVGMSISCNTSFNGVNSGLNYKLQGQCIANSSNINLCTFHYFQHPHNLPVVYQLPYYPVVVYPSVGCLYQVLMDTLCITMEERLY